jgi:hypothetical protein
MMKEYIRNNLDYVDCGLWKRKEELVADCVRFVFNIFAKDGILSMNSPSVLYIISCHHETNEHMHANKRSTCFRQL